MTAPRDDVFWSAGDHPQATPLDRDLSVDVVVVGGGMAGLTCARTLRERGLHVAVLERALCGSGASGKSSGFITPDSEMQLSDLVLRFGDERGGALWRLVEGGVELVRETIQELDLHCDYEVQDSLLVGIGAGGARHVEGEHRTRLRMGYPSALLGPEEVPSVLGSRRYTGAVRYPGTFGMSAYRYCRGLCAALAARAVAIHERTEVTGISPAGVTAGAHEVRAGHVVVCTDRFTPALGLLVDQVDHVQTFLAVSEPLPDATLAQLFPAGPVMVWDTRVTYHYLRIVDGSRLLVGGADLLRTYARHERHDPRKNLAKLARYAHATFPDLRARWEYVWPGFLGVSKDLLPLAGRDRRWPNVRYVVAATGLPWAAALGRSAAESIARGNDDVLELDPYRRAGLGPRMSHVLSKPVAFALSHVVQKLRQRMGGHDEAR